MRTDPVMRVPWISWGLLTLMSTFVAGSALWVALTPAGDQTELVDRTWEQFAQADPEVASLYSMDLVILGLFGVGFGLLAAAVSLVPYRHGERWAWLALWLVPITTGAVTVRMLADQYSTGYLYAGFTAVALVAIVVPARRFLRPRDRGATP